MKVKKFLINSRTSGKFKRETIDGREHIVTTMMPIRGDITMNGKFYPDAEVSASFEQFDLLPAPNGHPVVNGVGVSAFHPVANNKHNIGGFLRNSRKKGKRVFVDFVLDVEVANRTDDGKVLIERIENGKKVGVSTGLEVGMVTNASGSDDFGKEYNMQVGKYKFDHVAILLNEHAAGEHAGTELVLNEDGEEIIVCNMECDKLSPAELDSELSVIFANSNNDDFIGWLEKNEFLNNKKVNDMDKNKLVLAIIANSSNKYTVKDNAELMAMSDDNLSALISNSIDVDGAKEILTNSGVDLSQLDEFTANKADFDAFKASKKAETDKVIDSIVTNSEYTPEMLAGKAIDELNILNALATKKDAVRIAEGTAPVINNSANNAEVNYT